MLLLSQPPKYWDYKRAPLCPALKEVFKGVTDIYNELTFSRLPFKIGLASSNQLEYLREYVPNRKKT